MLVSVDFLTQVPRLLKELLGIAESEFEVRRQRRKEFFQAEIVPTHQQMEAINANYMKTFTQLLGLFETENDIPATVELLKEERLGLIEERKDVQARGAAIKEIRKSTYIRKREIAAFVEFAEEIKKYLTGANPGGIVSWYQDFVNRFEMLAKHGESPFRGEYTAIESGGPPAELVKSAFYSRVHHDLPEAWGKYTASYHKLRLELTR